MPVKGMDRKAKPSHVYAAIDYGEYPKPGRHESFRSFVRKLPVEQYLTKVLMALGHGEPSRREYESRLQELRDELFRVSETLYHKFREGKADA